MIKVLIVDDEPKIRRGLESLVKNISPDYIVDVAENGEIALEKIRICQTDIVFTDIKMPGMDGLTFMAAARALNKDLEFVVVSGYAEFEFAQEAMKYGAIHYILKPVMPDQIQSVLNKAVGQIEERRAEQEVMNQLKTVYHSLRGQHEDKETASDLAVESGIVSKVILYVKDHYSEKITLAEVAGSVYMHPTSVSKIFKKETGITLSEFIVTYRIKKAKEFLCDPAYKVYDVADMVGFSGSKYFINVFKSKTGMTPNEFRYQNIK